ncbi:MULTISPECIES: Hsp20/alpha crystallin family protein [Salipiger]|nr:MULTISPECIES: Hsp20/alpha crystallin family protein [Salipiger]GGA16938.1 hypothetical protein GCM10011326_31810 [Salipiger profundus]SFD32854.1 hypothetical protein SAMN05444415_109222 [Salipiger profundus]
MAQSRVQNLMLSDALSRLKRIEALQRLDFGVSPHDGWEPPMDLIETETELLAYVALPGVDTETIEIDASAGRLRLSGRRDRPEALRNAAILRLELPWGRFERQVAIPDAPYRVTREVCPGGLLIRLAKISRGAVA